MLFDSGSENSLNQLFVESLFPHKRVLLRHVNPSYPLINKCTHILGHKQGSPLDVDSKYLLNISTLPGPIISLEEYIIKPPCYA